VDRLLMAGFDSLQTLVGDAKVPHGTGAKAEIKLTVMTCDTN
jgi:hypothetical protein